MDVRPGAGQLELPNVRQIELLPVAQQDAYHFYKPPTAEVQTVGEATGRLGSADHARFRAIADDVYAQTGLKGADVKPAITIGARGADAGFVTVLTNASEELLRYSGAVLMKLGNLKGTASFLADQAGPVRCIC